MKPSRLVRALLLPACLLALAASPALAEDGAGQDIKAKIKAKMEKILELMKANEKALVELSVGKEAKPRHVDVDVPPPDGKGSDGAAGGDGASAGNQGGTTGAGAQKQLEELLRAMESGGTIPTELKELVEMIPT